MWGNVRGLAKVLAVMPEFEVELAELCCTQEFTRTPYIVDTYEGIPLLFHNGRWSYTESNRTTLLLHNMMQLHVNSLRNVNYVEDYDFLDSHPKLLDQVKKFWVRRDHIMEIVHAVETLTDIKTMLDNGGWGDPTVLGTDVAYQKKRIQKHLDSLSVINLMDGTI